MSMKRTLGEYLSALSADTLAEEFAAYDFSGGKRGAGGVLLYPVRKAACVDPGRPCVRAIIWILLWEPSLDSVSSWRWARRTGYCFGASVFCMELACFFGFSAHFLLPQFHF